MKKTKKRRSKKMLAIVIVLVCILIGTIGQLSLKKGMNTLGEFKLNQIFSSRFFEVFTHPFILLGIILYSISTVLWLVALSMLDVSFMYPLISLSYVLIAILAMTILKEQVTMVRWLGIVLILAGSFFIMRSG